jgi:predicted DNA-binding transcriptional regulator YafY
MVLSYEAFLQYAESPFSIQSGSAITKLRNAMPPDVVRELDRLRAYVSVDEPVRQYEAPHLAQILQASVDGMHLRIVYESASGVTERVIFPYGLYAQQGFWYCACYDYRRQDHLSLRTDHIRSAERVGGMERPEPVSLRDWLQMRWTADDRLRLRARTTRRGAKSLELATLFGRIPTDERGEGIIESWIPAREVGFYAARLLTLGTELIVEEPPELVQAMVEKARAIASQYMVR